MMKQLPALTIALLLVGCGNTAEQPAAPATQPSQPSQPEPSKSAAPTTGAPTSNPKRIYQLADLQRVTLKANGHDIPAWVMDTDAKRQEGMMFLTDREVKADEGMLFVFAKPDKQAFWMENTILPLDIIYLTDKGKVVNIQKGKPFDETSLPSAGPAQFVLEMKQGSSGRLGIKPGTTVAIPSGLASKD